jgi:hypothetical protein
MVALFVAGTFLLCVIVDSLLHRKHAVKTYDGWDGVRSTEIGLCMADGGDPLNKEKK